MRRRDPSEPRRFQVDLPADLHQHLRRTAFEAGTSGAAIIRGLLEQWAVGQSPHNEAVRAAYAAGVRAERDRIRRLLESPQVPPSAGQACLPVRPPTGPEPGVSTSVDTPASGL